MTSDARDGALGWPGEPRDGAGLGWPGDWPARTTRTAAPSGGPR
ncbi:hypothetical protein [Modestobacter altitudinis]|nr:hypothetical protein [Modestobacter altitudinis]